ncbi:MAG TPA: tetratricopeptide repeat protein [Rhodocyclaceae bacterium]
MSDPTAAPEPIPEVLARLLKLVGGPRDNALLHHAIGSEWMKAGRPREAAAALHTALARDPNFSAAWKLLGKALLEDGDNDAACAAWQQGIVVAEARGDVQAAKEMQVFLRRVGRATGA